MATTTVSVGVASLEPSARTTIGHLIKAADSALYTAKACGRNQTYPAAPQQKRLAA